MATKTKKPTTTTKKPAAKKTAVVKAHRGMAHVPRGRRRPIIGKPRRPGGPLLGPDDRPIRERDSRKLTRNRILSGSRPQVEPRRRGDDRPRGRNPQIMTPAMRRRLMELRRRAQQRRQLPPLQGRQPTATEVAQLKAARDRFNKMQEANVFGRRRKPTQATQTPKVPTARKRPTGTPRGPRPQVTPRKRNFRFRGRRT